MSEITGAARVHEAYAFACMRCGHGWEQAYEIEHHLDAEGREYVVYRADGVRVPSPLSSPTCGNCGGHVVRIMRAGQVSSVLDRAAGAGRSGRVVEERTVPIAGPIGATDYRLEPVTDPGALPPQPDPPHQESHHWHLSDLLHPFRHHRNR
ncbi:MULTISPECIES: hypothetical protein [Streptomyces]|uniref:C2H2-type domain-containing protein n=1 Tax=Streptomyces tsukubensis (strain DSM 42081 / NBRC 108919 / NRRL 18488 / 9993) TaxID=1114943 RepID=I2MZR3_STRT9|nr:MULTISPECIES: hypothetical protein [Streptomyces]AZK94503.1 hypothetical protein B7R87_12015 [Streptomyces tsukubensis]EIF90260.1 hypothetical protein [Streptomyces tsukubensis NRRL18488]MYS62853.1 hypothetical protein [Streptomyces sp. SID5473]QKM69407.1 hypothetical protein STSU_021765 [Streptomyces tsukubensis NRRL18488]TAI42662.1 hypothetical protein EWI31_19765 [Streptomyces tsukubensis]